MDERNFYRGKIRKIEQKIILKQCTVNTPRISSGESGIVEQLVLTVGMAMEQRGAPAANAWPGRCWVPVSEIRLSPGSHLEQ